MISSATPPNCALARDFIDEAPLSGQVAGTVFLPRWSRWLGWGLLLAWALFVWYITHRYYVSAVMRPGVAPPGEVRTWLSLAAILPDTLLMGTAFVLARWLPLEPHNWSRRVWVHLAAPAAATMLDYGVAALSVRWFIEPGPALLSTLLNCAIFYALPSAFAHALQFVEQARQQQVRSLLLHTELAEAEGKRTRAELRALRVDLNPNLLFDTLRTISELMHRDAAAANRVLVRLSELLRHLLAGAGAREVRLQDELEALRLYLDLRSACEDEPSRISWNAADDALQTRVPYLLLRSLLGVAAGSVGAPPAGSVARTIEVQGRVLEGGTRLELAVRYAGPAPAAGGAGGVDAARARLDQLYPEGYELTQQRAPDGSSECAVSLPLRLTGEARSEAGADAAPAFRAVAPPAPLQLRMPVIPLRLWVLWFIAVWLFHVGGLHSGSTQGPLSPATTAGLLALTAAVKWSVALYVAVRLTGRLPLGVPFRWRVARVHALAALCYGLFALASRLLADAALGTRSPVHQPGIAVGAVLMNAVIYALFTGAAHTALYAHALGARRIAELRLRRILVQAELDRSQAEMRALKMELNPHFLFNALNSISSLLYSDVEAATHMVERLRELLRRALAQVDTQCVPLRDEIELLRLYLEIEQTRFGERLAVEWEVEPGMLDAEVPHLVLQPLVENAIKHAIAPRSTRGRMRIVARAEDEVLHLQVHDDGPGLRPASRPGATGGIGLANTRARLQQLYGGEHRFELHSSEAGGVVAAISIPLRMLYAPAAASS